MDTLNLKAEVAKFQLLQDQLRDRWRNSDQFDLSDADIVVIPSISIDQRSASTSENS